jgi:hypothetical protein
MIVADIPGYKLAGAYTHDAEDSETLHDNNFFVDDHAQTIKISDHPVAPVQEIFHIYVPPDLSEI